MGLDEKKELGLYLVYSGLDGYDQFRQMVVAAVSEQQARNIHPMSERQDADMEFLDTGEATTVIELTLEGFQYRERHFYKGMRKGEAKLGKTRRKFSCWVQHPRDVVVERIGTANTCYCPGEVIITDYHHG